MKYLSEFREPELVSQLMQEIRDTVSKDWNIMEVCGGQTHSLVKNGIIQMLPPEINMIHGPGCPVCVTPIALIDKAISLAINHNVILCTFGDMMRVPGSQLSLLEAKARGGDIRMVYSPLDALSLAKSNPDREVVFFAVGFETTAPANALSVIQAVKRDVSNYSLLTSHVLVPPAIEAIMSDEESNVNAFLAAGHVCAIMGESEYEPLVTKYEIPIVITGFEPVDLLQGILMVVKQLEGGKHQLENQYARVVSSDGNLNAKEAIFSVFEISDREWRGIGGIPASGYELKKNYRKYDANHKFSISVNHEVLLVPNLCIAGEILKGMKKPFECPQFGEKCTPEHPLGAPMVSSEGACAAYYHYHGAQKQEA